MPVKITKYPSCRWRAMNAILCGVHRNPVWFDWHLQLKATVIRDPPVYGRLMWFVCPGCLPNGRQPILATKSLKTNWCVQVVAECNGPRGRNIWRRRKKPPLDDVNGWIQQRRCNGRTFPSQKSMPNPKHDPRGPRSKESGIQGSGVGKRQWMLNRWQ